MGPRLHDQLVRAGGVGERHLAADERVQRAILKTSCEGGMNLDEVGLGHVEQRHAEDDSIPAHRVAGIDLDTPATADHDDPPMLGKHAEVLVEVDVGQHLDDEIDASPCRRLHDVIDVLLSAVIDDDLRAVLAHSGQAFLGAARADHPEAMSARQLDGCDADGTGGAMDQDCFCRPGMGPMEERAIRGGVRNAECGALRERRSRRQPVDLRCRAHDALAVRARVRSGDVHTIADGEPGDAAAERLDFTRSVGARGVRQPGEVRIGAGADVGIDGIHAGGADADDDLFRTGGRVADRLNLHHIRSAEFVDDDRSHDPPGVPAPMADAIMRNSMTLVRLHKTVAVKVGSGKGVQVGGGAPVVVQSMTMTDTADARATASQCIELAEAGSEMVRVTVNLPQAAAAVPEIKARMIDAGCEAPLIGDFHYNGHLLLTKYPECARALDKYRINPGNVGTGRRRDEQFSTICKVAVDNDKPVRIGVNAGSLNQDLVVSKMQENSDRDLGKSSEEIINECLILSAVESCALAIDSGLRANQIIISCKTSRPRDLISVYRALARATDQPLHLGLTEAGMGMKGLVWSASAMGVLLNEGIGDTIRVSLTPRPGGDRREEVYAACELLQALGLRSFAPSVTACPGCGRTTSSTFQELAERIQGYVRDKMPEWKATRDGVETMTLAVMGCVVNGPGESKAANIGISLPGTGEAPNCPIFIDGKHAMTLRGTYEELAAEFQRLVDEYVEQNYARR